MLIMSNKIKILILLSTIFLLGFIGLTPIQSLAAVDCSQPNLTTQEAIQCGTNSAGGNQGNASDKVNGTIRTFINLLTAAVGVAAVIMIIVGGFRYITSGGASEKVTSAKNTILYAVIGLVVVALAQVIVRFVLFRVT
jgi:hypothetical protein